MSDNELELSMELDTYILWDESEVVPVPLSDDQLQSLVCEEEQLFTPYQLMGMVNSPTSRSFYSGSKECRGRVGPAICRFPLVQGY